MLRLRWPSPQQTSRDTRVGFVQNCRMVTQFYSNSWNGVYLQTNPIGGITVENHHFEFGKLSKPMGPSSSLEVSYKKGLPLNNPFLNRMLHEINHPASLGIPHGYGIPHVELSELQQLPLSLRRRCERDLSSCPKPSESREWGMGPQFMANL